MFLSRTFSEIFSVESSDAVSYSPSTISMALSCIACEL